MDVATPPRFVGATAPPPPSTPPPHQSTPWTTSPACSGDGPRRRTPPNTSEICESPLLHILAGLSSATTTPMRTTKREMLATATTAVVLRNRARCRGRCYSRHFYRTSKSMRTMMIIIVFVGDAKHTMIETEKRIHPRYHHRLQKVAKTRCSARS